MKNINDLPAASEVGLRDPVQQLQKQNLALKRVIKDIWWMARRYADGLSTFAPSLYNQMIDLAIKNGVQIDSNEIYAENGNLGKWIPEQQCFKGDIKMTCCKTQIDPQLFRELLTAAIVYQSAYRTESARPLSSAESEAVAKADLTVARAQIISNQNGLTRD